MWRAGHGERAGTSRRAHGQRTHQERPARDAGDLGLIAHACEDSHGESTTATTLLLYQHTGEKLEGPPMCETAAPLQHAGLWPACTYGVCDGVRTHPDQRGAVRLGKKNTLEWAAVPSPPSPCVRAWWWWLASSQLADHATPVPLQRAAVLPPEN